MIQINFRKKIKGQRGYFILFVPKVEIFFFHCNPSMKLFILIQLKSLHLYCLQQEMHRYFSIHFLKGCNSKNSFFFYCNFVLFYFQGLFICSKLICKFDIFPKIEFKLGIVLFLINFVTLLIIRINLREYFRNN